MAGRGAGLADAEELVGEIIRLEYQLKRIAASPVVSGARELAAEVAPVLEPVWSIVGTEGAAVKAIGFLRRFGEPTVEPPIGDANAVVSCSAVAVFGAAELTAPSREQVWDALARPAQTLVAAVEVDHSLAGTLCAGVSPRLPAELIADWSGDEAVVATLRRVLRMWCDIARHASGERGEAARLLLAAAQLARGAALDGDKDTVRWFVKRWLNLMPTEARVDGVIAALFTDGWQPPFPDPALSEAGDRVTDLLVRATSLRTETKRQHRLHRPVWETQLLDTPVALLSEELEYGTLADLLGEADSDPAVAVTQTLLTEQIGNVLETLSAREERVIRAFADGLPWTQISKVFGITRYELDKLRESAFRKLRHPSRAGVLRDYADNS